MIRWVADMPIHLLRFDDIVKLLILLLLMHVLSDMRSGFVQTQHSSLRSEADLVLEEVSQFFESNALVCRGVNPPDDSEKFSLGQEERVAFEKVIKVYFINLAFVLSVYRSVHCEGVVVWSSFQIVSELF